MKIIFKKEEYDIFYKRAIDELHEFIKYKEKINQANEDLKRQILFDDMINGTNGAVLYALVDYLVFKLSFETKDTWNHDTDSHRLMGYFIKMISSHQYIIRDFEFYNIALITKYMLESVSGISKHRENLNDHFKDLNFEEYNKRLLEKNYKITNLIGEELGKEASKIYSKVSAYSHPHAGPLYGLDTFMADKRNGDLLGWLLFSYKICLEKILEILEIDYNVEFINELFKYNRYFDATISSL